MYLIRTLSETISLYVSAPAVEESSVRTPSVDVMVQVEVADEQLDSDWCTRSDNTRSSEHIVTVLLSQVISQSHFPGTSDCKPTFHVNMLSRPLTSQVVPCDDLARTPA